MKMEQTVCSEMSAYKIQSLENYPKESIQHSKHGESLKSRLQKLSFIVTIFKLVNCSHHEQFTADSGCGDNHISNNHQSKRTTLGEYHGW